MREPIKPVDDIKTLQKMIDEEQFKKAKTFAEKLSAESQSARADANFWFTYGLAVRLTHRNREVLENISHNMFYCKNYSPIMAGDWLRDDVLNAIRQNKLTDAVILLRELHTLHQNDANRLIGAQMVEGRLAYARKDYSIALSCFFEAEKKWRSLKTNADNKLLRDNNFAMYKTMVVLKDDRRYSAAMEIINNDKNRTHQLRARFINSTGRFGNAIDDLLVRIRFA